MDLQLVRAYDGPTLRVTRVTPGGPAQRAGLEVGDEIRTVNGYGFQQATNSYHGVYLMNQFTAINASAPAAAAPAQASPSVQVAPSPSQGPPVARMIVRNVRNGQNVQLSVYPQFRNSILPAPAPAAPAVRSSGNGR